MNELDERWDQMAEAHAIHEERERKATADRRIVEAARALVELGPQIHQGLGGGYYFTCCFNPRASGRHSDVCVWDKLRRAIEAADKEKPGA